MIYNPVFNPIRDIEETIPELSADLAEVMASGTVVSSGSLNPNFTKETDINEVGHYLRDKIQTAIAAKNLGESMSRQAAAYAAAQADTSSPSVSSNNPKGD